MPKKVDPDFSGARTVPHPSVRIVTITYADGKTVRVEDIGDGALIDLLREYVALRELDRVFPGMPLASLRDVKEDIAEAHAELVSDRNRRHGVRKEPEVTKEVLLSYRDKFERANGKVKGWKKAASRDYGIGLDALNARIR